MILGKITIWRASENQTNCSSYSFRASQSTFQSCVNFSLMQHESFLNANLHSNNHKYKSIYRAFVLGPDIQLSLGNWTVFEIVHIQYLDCFHLNIKDKNKVWSWKFWTFVSRVNLKNELVEIAQNRSTYIE